jgi:hypothetical protein
MSDIDTGAWIRQLTRDTRSQHPEYPDLHTLGILLGHDGSEKGKMGQGRLRTSYPLSWTVSVLPRWMRNTFHWRDLLCYSPKAPGDLQGTKAMKREYKRVLKHCTFKTVLQAFKKFADAPFPLTFKTRTGETKTLFFIVRLLLCVADHPELQLLSGFYASTQAACPCNRCRVPQKEIFSTSMSSVTMHGLRDHDEIDAGRWLMQHEADPSIRKQAKQFLHSMSVHQEAPGSAATEESES